MNNTKKLVYGSLFAALCCVATMIIHIPTPGTGGYIHPGDAFVILSGIVLGPVYGGLAAGIGSALADFFAGYYIYVPATFLIKFAIAALCGLLYQYLNKRGVKYIIAGLIAGLIDVILVAGGYFVYEYFLYGLGAAASIPANIIQGISGMIFATLLLPFVKKIPEFTQMAR